MDHNFWSVAGLERRCLHVMSQPLGTEVISGTTENEKKSMSRFSLIKKLAKNRARKSLTEDVSSSIRTVSPKAQELKPRAKAKELKPEKLNPKS